MTFHDLMEQFRCTEHERVECAWFLATLRMRKTLEACLGASATFRGVEP